MAEELFVAMLDILREHGADFCRWANESHYPPADEHGMMNRTLFLDDFVPTADTEREITIRGRKHTFVQKGDVDHTAHTRAVMKRVF